MPATALPTATDLDRLVGIVVNPVTAIDGTNGNSYPYNDGKNFLFVKNADATDSITITPIPTVTVPEGSDEVLEVTPVPITVPALTTKQVGGWSFANFADADGNITVEYAFNGGAVAGDVTVQLVHLD